MNEKQSYTYREKFQKAVDYEQLLAQQMNRISQYRSSNNVNLYEISIDTLILMLPRELRNKATEYKRTIGAMFDLSLDGLMLYDDLWRFINENLEESNLIFRTSYIKTYE